MKIRVIAWLCLGLLPLGGCETPPAVHDVERTRTYAKSKNVVWERLIQHLSSANIPIKTIDRDSGIVYAEPVGVDFTNYADCGASFPVILSRTAAINVFVKPLRADRTQATVNATFTARRYAGSLPPSFVSCTSRGGFEKDILDAL